MVLQAGLAAARGGAVLVALEARPSRRGCRAGCRQQAVQQEDVEKRMVSAVMPTGTKGSRSMQRTSTYSTPRSRSACSGRSPGWITRLGRMVP
jgi:hypothetical protein